MVVKVRRWMRSRETREFLEVWLPLFEESLFAFFGFLGQIVKQGSVPGKLLHSHRAVGVGIDRHLQEADSQRAFFQDFACPLDAFILKLLKRHDLVDQSHLKGFLGIILAAQIPDLARSLVPYHASQEAHPIARIKTADLWPGLAEARVFGGDCQVAHHVQDVSAANGIASDEGDNWLGHLPDEALQFEHVETRYAIVTHVAAVASHALVAARAKCLAACPRKEDHANAGIILGIAEGVDHLANRLWTEGVANLRAVDRDFGNAFAIRVVLIDYVLVIANLPPGNSHRLPCVLSSLIPSEKK